MDRPGVRVNLGEQDGSVSSSGAGASPSKPKKPGGNPRSGLFWGLAIAIGVVAAIITFAMTGTPSPPVHPQREPRQDVKAIPTPSPKPALSPGWNHLRATMTKAEVQSLLGVPNLKSNRKWGYVGGGLVSFDAQELVTSFTVPK